MIQGLLQDFVIIFSLSLVVILLFRKLRVPSALAFLAAGIIAGPHGLGLVRNIESIETFAEIGVIFLMFTIGIEISMKSLFRTRKVVFLGGSLQVLFITLATGGILKMIGWSWQTSVFGGFITALSSTAIVLKMLQEQAELSQPHGRTSMGILIFQDIAVIPMMLVIPLLAGNGGGVAFSLTGFLFRMAGILALLFVSAKWIVPWLLHSVALLKRRDLFLLTILLLAFAVAWITSSIGLSLALGAFFAGLVISESDYHHHAFGDILPFRDVFLSFFFVSVGMLFDPGFMASHFLLIIVLVFLLMLGKIILTACSVLITGYSLLTALLTGMFLSQVGEFSFVLAQLGLNEKLLNKYYYQLFLAVAVITMAVTPFLIASSRTVSEWIRRHGAKHDWITGRVKFKHVTDTGLSQHLVIIGFGRNGRNVARAARQAGITYAILDVDPDKVRLGRKQKEKIFFGDASYASVLQQAFISKALVVAVSIADLPTTFRIIESVRILNPGAYMIVRTRYAESMEDLFKAGADEVIPEEIETSVRIFASILARFQMPREDIEQFENTLRAKGYEMLLSETRQGNLLGDSELTIPDLEIATYRVQEEAPAAGLSIRDAAVRQRWDITILAIFRNNQYITNPQADMVMIPDDHIIIIGTQEKVSAAGNLFRMAKTGLAQL